MIHKQPSAKDVLVNALYEIEALLNILDKKGLLSKQEVLDEMRRLKMQEKEGDTIVGE